jgi:hypothetical protein
MLVAWMGVAWRQPAPYASPVVWRKATRSYAKVEMQFWFSFVRSTYLFIGRVWLNELIP